MARFVRVSKMNINEVIIKLILFWETFFVILSPKGVKALLGYTGIYPNPQFMFLLICFPLLIYLKAVNLKKILKDKVLILSLIFIISLYWLSGLHAITRYTFVKSYFPLSGTTRQTLNLLLIFVFYYSLSTKYVMYLGKVLIFLGIFEILFVIYGILGFLEIIPISLSLKEYATQVIYVQGWTVIGFIPKWGGTFPETQVLSSFLFFVLIILDNISIYGSKKNKLVSFIKFFLIVAIYYLFSKSTTIFLTLYLLYKLSGKLHLKKLYIPTAFSIFISGISFFYYKLKFLNLFVAAQEANSFAERLFHIIKTFEYMSNDIISMLIGLGPRVYGSLLSSEYPISIWNEYSNAISFFNVLADIGILGFVSMLFFLYLILKKIKLPSLKIGGICVFSSIMLQIAWGGSYLYMMLGFLPVLDTYLRNQKKKFMIL